MHDFFHANADALAFESYFNLADNLLDPIAAPQSRGRYQAGWRA